MGPPRRTSKTNARAERAEEIDQPTAALLKDLKQRGLLDDTLVIWGGEFGRTPTRDAAATPTGRDHNHRGFTMWLAGGGVKGGIGLRRDRRVRLHAPSRTRSTSTTCTRRSCTCSASTTTKLTYRYAGRDFRLTDVHGNVVKDIIA